MNFEQPDFNNELIPEKGNYEKARSEADVLLEKYDFIKNEDIKEINPEKVKDEMPVFVSPGWGVVPESQEESLKTISEEGRKVLTISFSRERKVEQSDTDIPTAELQKALSIIEAISKKGINRVDAIGHSEGGLNLVIAANLFPEKFRNIVLVSPAGMIENDSSLNLMKRFIIDEGIQELGVDKSIFFKYIKEVFKYSIKGSKLSYEEISACAVANIFQMTEQLREKGVKVGFICGANDKVFPIEEVVKRVGKENADHFLSTKGDHGSFIFNKEHALLAENLLDNMKK
ncbi:MAG: alpha/beta hydrolase [Minisyncoccales bacterium]